jgi:hypothetical protein
MADPSPLGVMESAPGYGPGGEGSIPSGGVKRWKAHAEFRMAAAGRRYGEIMKAYIHKERFFLEEDPEFVSFFSGAVITDTQTSGPGSYISLSMGDGNDSICSWMWELDKDGVAALKRYADAMRRLAEAGKRYADAMRRLAEAGENALEEHG